MMKQILGLFMIFTLILQIYGQRNLYRSNRRRTNQDIDREESLPPPPPPVSLYQIFS